MYIPQFIRKKPLAVMFSILIAGAMIVISTVIYWYQFEANKKALKENVHHEAKTVLDFADVLLQSRNEKFFSGESPEVPQVIQNEVFDRFTKISKGKVFFKEASKHPTNPKNKALPFEARMIDYFETHKQVKEKSAEVEYQGKPYYMLARPIVAEKRCKLCHPAWTPGNVIAIEAARIDLSDYMAALKENVIYSFLNWFVNIVVVLLVIHLLFKNVIASRLEKLLNIFKRVEKGKFFIDDILGDDARVDPASRNEIDQLFFHLKQMVDALRPVIGKVVKQSKDVAFEASYGVVKLRETDASVREQTGEVERIASSLRQIGEMNRELGEKLEELVTHVDRSVQLIESGQSQMHENAQETRQASEALDRTIASVEELKGFSDEVAKTIDLISDIADETNLIALNAAIEAARAGEHGRGFAVVADKVRELAEISMENAENTRKIIRSMLGNLDGVVQRADETRSIFIKMERSNEEVARYFREIEETQHKTLDTMFHFGEAFTREQKAFEEILNRLDGVTEGNEKIIKATENVESVMGMISEASAELKLLSDGFETVMNQRKAPRTIVSPPVPLTICYEDGVCDRGYVFDVSEGGVSFYAIDPSARCNRSNVVGQRGHLKLDQPVKGLHEIDFEVVYQGEAKFGHIKFCGAKRV